MFIWNIIRIPLRIVSDWALRRYNIVVKQGDFGGWIVYHGKKHGKVFFLESSAYVFAFNLIEQIKND